MKTYTDVMKNYKNFFKKLLTFKKEVVIVISTKR